MDVIHFEATVDGDFQEDTNKADFCVERNDIDFIDDFDVSDNVCDYYNLKTSHVWLEIPWRTSFLRVTQILRIIIDIEKTPPEEKE